MESGSQIMLTDQVVHDTYSVNCSFNELSEFIRFIKTDIREIGDLSLENFGSSAVLLEFERLQKNPDCLSIFLRDERFVRCELVIEEPCKPLSLYLENFLKPLNLVGIYGACLLRRKPVKLGFDLSKSEIFILRKKDKRIRRFRKRQARFISELKSERAGGRHNEGVIDVEDEGTSRGERLDNWRDGAANSSRKEPRRCQGGDDENGPEIIDVEEESSVHERLGKRRDGTGKAARREHVLKPASRPREYGEMPSSRQREHGEGRARGPREHGEELARRPREHDEEPASRPRENGEWLSSRQWEHGEGRAHRPRKHDKEPASSPRERGEELVSRPREHDEEPASRPREHGERPSRSAEKPDAYEYVKLADVLRMTEGNKKLGEAVNFFAVVTDVIEDGHPLQLQRKEKWSALFQMTVMVDDDSVPGDCRINFFLDYYGRDQVDLVPLRKGDVIRVHRALVNRRTPEAIFFKVWNGWSVMTLKIDGEQRTFRSTAKDPTKPSEARWERVRELSCWYQEKAGVFAPPKLPQKRRLLDRRQVMASPSHEDMAAGGSEPSFPVVKLSDITSYGKYCIEVQVTKHDIGRHCILVSDGTQCPVVLRDPPRLGAHDFLNIRVLHPPEMDTVLRDMLHQTVKMNVDVVCENKSTVFRMIGRPNVMDDVKTSPPSVPEFESLQLIDSEVVEVADQTVTVARKTVSRVIETVTEREEVMEVADVPMGCSDTYRAMPSSSDTRDGTSTAAKGPENGQVTGRVGEEMEGQVRADTAYTTFGCAVNAIENGPVSSTSGMESILSTSGAVQGRRRVLKVVVPRLDMDTLEGHGSRTPTVALDGELRPAPSKKRGSVDLARPTVRTRTSDSVSTDDEVDMDILEGHRSRIPTVALDGELRPAPPKELPVDLTRPTVLIHPSDIVSSDDEVIIHETDDSGDSDSCPVKRRGSKTFHVESESSSAVSHVSASSVDTQVTQESLERQSAAVSSQYESHPVPNTEYESHEPNDGTFDSHSCQRKSKRKTIIPKSLKTKRAKSCTPTKQSKRSATHYASERKKGVKTSLGIIEEDYELTVTPISAHQTANGRPETRSPKCSPEGRRRRLFSSQEDDELAWLKCLPLASDSDSDDEGMKDLQLLMKEIARNMAGQHLTTEDRLNLAGQVLKEEENVSEKKLTRVKRRILESGFDETGSIGSFLDQDEEESPYESARSSAE